MELSEYRQKLDGIDAQLLALFLERMKIVGEIAVWKQANSMPVSDPRREREKLGAIEAQSPEALRPYTTALFSKIMELSRCYQDRLLHPEGD